MAEISKGQPLYNTALYMTSMHSAEESPAEIEEKAIKILIAEDDPGDAKLVRWMLSKSTQPYEAEVVGCVASTIKSMHDDKEYSLCYRARTSRG